MKFARPAPAGRAVAAIAVALAASVTLGLLACAALAGGLPVLAQTTRKLPPGVIYANPGLRSITSGPFDFARGIGLVEGDRKDSLWLCIADTSLAVGDSLTLISDDPDPDKDTYVTLISAAVAERLPYTTRDPSIPLRLAKLSDSKNSRTDFFYRLVAPPGALDCCIFGYAVRAPRSGFHVGSGRAEADLDHDGVPEHFQSCTSTEGLWASVWSGEPFRGPQRWTRYYPLGYSVEPNCPGLDSLSAK